MEIDYLSLTRPENEMVTLTDEQAKQIADLIPITTSIDIPIDIPISIDYDKSDWLRIIYMSAPNNWLKMHGYPMRRLSFYTKNMHKCREANDRGV